MAPGIRLGEAHGRAVSGEVVVHVEARKDAGVAVLELRHRARDAHGLAVEVDVDGGRRARALDAAGGLTDAEALRRLHRHRSHCHAVDRVAPVGGAGRAAADERVRSAERRHLSSANRNSVLADDALDGSPTEEHHVEHDLLARRSHVARELPQGAARGIHREQLERRSASVLPHVADLVATVAAEGDGGQGRSARVLAGEIRLVQVRHESGRDRRAVRVQHAAGHDGPRILEAHAHGHRLGAAETAFGVAHLGDGERRRDVRAFGPCEREEDEASRKLRPGRGHAVRGDDVARRDPGGGRVHRPVEEHDRLQAEGARRVEGLRSDHVRRDHLRARRRDRDRPVDLAGERPVPFRIDFDHDRRRLRTVDGQPRLAAGSEGWERHLDASIGAISAGESRG